VEIVQETRSADHVGPLGAPHPPGCLRRWRGDDEVGRVWWERRRSRVSSPIRNRESALEFLFGRIDYERTQSVPYRSRRFKLDRMRRLVSLLEHPEQAFPAVHIAGTKGKGSTACMIAAALTTAGLRTGLYTSPHLDRLEERFVVDGTQCSEAELVTLLADLQPAVARLDAAARTRGDQQRPTYFEITTAAALLHFQRRQVDCAVLEVGLGGRLDSTNICQPAVSVVTTISLDHTRQLGKTLAQIAGEKAGIIKPGIPVITGVVQPEPFQVIDTIAQNQGSRLLALGRDFHFDYVGPCNPHTGSLLNYWEQVDSQRRSLEHVQIGMRGRHQTANAAVALATLGQLQRAGWAVDERSVRSGLSQARCPARFEVIAEAPTVILDAAHNPASVVALCETLREQYPSRPRLLVFAASIDKDVPRMIEQLLPEFQHIVLTRYLNNPRAMDPQQMRRVASGLANKRGQSDLQLQVCPDPQAAWHYVASSITPSHVVCVAGSFFLAAEIRKHVSGAPYGVAGASKPSM
jgi:dihydrofolate synthase/folylpolyglutamate synthase